MVWVGVCGAWCVVWCVVCNGFRAETMVIATAINRVMCMHAAVVEGAIT